MAALATAGAATFLLPRLMFGSNPQLRKADWRVLEPVSPKLLLTLDDRKQVDYGLRDEGEIYIASENLTLLHLGRPVSGLFAFSVEVAHQELLNGGIFFQGLTNYTENGWVIRFQSLELKSQPNENDATLQHSLLWSQWTARQTDRAVSADCVPLAEVAISPATNSLVQQLQVTCGRQGMPEVEWNGAKLHESMWRFSQEARDLQRMAVSRLPTAFLGRLGLLNVQGSTRFIQPRLAYL